jgi:RNA polymerase sigma-70 factor (ECF subfamily)
VTEGGRLPPRFQQFFIGARERGQDHRKNGNGAAVVALISSQISEEGAMAVGEWGCEELLARARAGEEGALGRLLERYRRYLALLARVQIGRRLQGKAGPDDLVQESFLEASRHFAQFRGDSEPELAAWLRQILATCLAHLVRRYLGTQARDVQLERALADDLEQSSRAFGLGLAAEQSSPSQRASRREQAVLLADALDRLPADYREVLILRYLEGLTFPEVAARMGRTLGSVEKLWARALPRLRRAFGDQP